MTDDKKPITPQMKVAELLEEYPELEEMLIGAAPPFKKLRNPILRRSVARVATLRQAAAVAKLEPGSLINTLREAVGQEPWNESGSDKESYWQEQPPWFAEERVVASIDDRAPEDPNVMALVPVSKAAKALRQGEILRLVSVHLPAPGIDQLRARGFAFWCHQVADNEVHTYFTPDPTGAR